jgi:hypothetical protein
MPECRGPHTFFTNIVQWDDNRRIESDQFRSMIFSKTARAVITAVGIMLASVSLAAAEKARSVTGEFVGTTLADASLRTFLGGLANDAPCHCIKWRLSLSPQTETAGGGGTFRAIATYRLPGRDDPNQLEPGPTVEVKGKFELNHGRDPGSHRVVYRLQNANGKILELSQLTQNLLHCVDERGKLKVGDAGWSYTLNRKSHGETK